MPNPNKSGGSKTVLSLVPAGSMTTGYNIGPEMASSEKRLQYSGNKVDLPRELYAPSIVMPVYSNNNAS